MDHLAEAINKLAEEVANVGCELRQIKKVLIISKIGTIKGGWVGPSAQAKLEEILHGREPE